jgi:uncharacterized protein (DUF433 family)
MHGPPESNREAPDCPAGDAGYDGGGETEGIQTVDYRKHIVIDPGVRSGKPCVKGTRIAVYDVLSYLAAGMTPDEIVADFPDLKPEDIRACLAFAADRERRLAVA